MENGLQEIILIKTGEIALKGLNKGSFEMVLVKNIKRRLKALGSFEITKAQSTLYIKSRENGCDMEEAVARIANIFGIAAFSRAVVCEKDFADICRKGVPYLRGALKAAQTFKVVAKRSDKSFAMNSPQICTEFGAVLLEAYPHLRVDVNHPDVTVVVEIRDFGAYIHAGRIQGAGGMPIGTSGKAMLLLSGGIDSPVAGYMMAKRGLELSAVHFVSPPYTSPRALLKVEELCEAMSRYCGRIRFYCVPFTEIQEAIRDHCPSDLFTIIMRRMMYRLAQRAASREEALALCTGESVAQVASQTLSAIVCTDAVCEMPVFRPVIGMDKTEIVDLARKIGTFEISIQPYEDCCTVFTPKHPKTRPTLVEVEQAESAFDFGPLLEKAVAETTVKTISFGQAEPAVSSRM